MTTVRTHLILLLIVSAGSTGCVSTYNKLVPEDTIPTLLRLKEAASRQPNATHSVPTRIGSGPELKVALHETGLKLARRLVVLIHGCISDHRVWRFVTGDLGKDHRLLLVDLPGCGESDLIPPDALGSTGYAVDALAERTLQALEKFHAARKAEGPVTLVGHSLGGAVVLRMLANPALRARYPRFSKRVDRAVLLAPADVELVNPPPDLVEVAEVNGLEITVAEALGILREAVAAAVLKSVDDPARALREEADRLHEVMRDGVRRRPTQAMLRQFVPRRDDGQLDWPAIERMVADYGNVDVPCLILWGAHDKTLPRSMGFKLEKQIPGAKLETLPSCKHSPQLEHPTRCADYIRRFPHPGPKKSGAKATKAKTGESRRAVEPRGPIADVRFEDRNPSSARESGSVPTRGSISSSRHERHLERKVAGVSMRDRSVPRHCPLRQPERSRR